MNRIKELRADRNMTQADLAALLNCAPTAVSKWELEENGIDSRLIARLCDIFGCTSDYLLCRTSMPSAELSEGEYALIRAYRAADDRAKKVVRLTLEPFDREKG